MGGTSWDYTAFAAGTHHFFIDANTNVGTVGQNGSNHTGFNLNGSTAGSASIITTISVYTALAGQSYTLSGLVGDRASLNWVSVTFNLGTKSGSTFTPLVSTSLTNTAGTNGTWTPITTSSYTATGGEQFYVQVVGTRAAGGGTTHQVNFDNLIIDQVPEPSAALLGGLGLLALLRRRR